MVARRSPARVLIGGQRGRRRYRARPGASRPSWRDRTPNRAAHPSPVPSWPPGHHGTGRAARSSASCPARPLVPASRPGPGAALPPQCGRVQRLAVNVRTLGGLPTSPAGRCPLGLRARQGRPGHDEMRRRILLDRRMYQARKLLNSDIEHQDGVKRIFFLTSPLIHSGPSLAHADFRRPGIFLARGDFRFAHFQVSGRSEFRLPHGVPKRRQYGG